MSALLHTILLIFTAFSLALLVAYRLRGRVARRRIDQALATIEKHVRENGRSAWSSGSRSS